MDGSIWSSWEMRESSFSQTNHMDRFQAFGLEFLGEIEDLLKNTEVTPAQEAQELMKREDSDIVLGGGRSWKAMNQSIKMLKCSEFNKLNDIKLR
ncbi:hypothetical protein V6N13_111593 [Hibiscus sabdariffa]